MSGKDDRSKGSGGSYRETVIDSTCGRCFKQQEPSSDGKTVSGSREFPVMRNIQAELLLQGLSPEVPDSRGLEHV